MEKEWKIGEIRQVDGDWYQCIRSSDCSKCDLKNVGNCRFEFPCEILLRKDGEEVIYKKLEKAGNPYVSNGKSRQKYKLRVPFVLTNALLDEDIVVDDENGVVDIQIGQKEEDMEGKKEKLDKLVTDYVACRITYNQLDGELKAMYAGEKERESVTAEFDLEAAKAGKPVCTRDGRTVRILCFDAQNKDYPIVALVKNESKDKEHVTSYRKDGSVNPYIQTKNDLMMVVEKREGWINLYRKGYNTETSKEVFCSEEGAVEFVDDENNGENYITTLKINWKE